MAGQASAKESSAFFSTSSPSQSTPQAALARMREKYAVREPLEPAFDIKSSLISRNITILGKRTSVRLEPEMWQALKDISRREGCSIHELCSLISIRKRDLSSLTASIRVFLMLYYRAASTEDGHARAGHGNFSTMKRRARIDESVMSPQRAAL
jgi:predicted DNA-binding ribbon-helix-helix protein